MKFVSSVLNLLLSIVKSIGKILLKIWDFLLLFFAFSTTKHCDKLDIDDDWTRGNKN